MKFIDKEILQNTSNCSDATHNEAMIIYGLILIILVYLFENQLYKKSSSYKKIVEICGGAVVRVITSCLITAVIYVYTSWRLS